VIGKVIRGTNARRLLYYLYSPGKANEHTDPHLIAGFCDPADLEPGRRPDGKRDFGRLAGLLAQPLAALAGPGYSQPARRGWDDPPRVLLRREVCAAAAWARTEQEFFAQAWLRSKMRGMDMPGLNALRRHPPHAHPMTRSLRSFLPTELWARAGGATSSR
jgi:hypothetical protein